MKGNTPEAAIQRPRLRWMAITAPIVAFIMIKPVEGIARSLDISLFYGFEKGVHWYCLCWFSLTLFVQLILGLVALAEPKRSIEWTRLFGVAIPTSVGGVGVCFIGVWILAYLAFGGRSY